jgi:hypothetical protein
MNVANTLQVPLNHDSVSAAGLSGFTNQLTTYQSYLRSLRLASSTGLYGIFRTIESDQSQTRSIIAVVGVELVLLALLVLYGVAAGTTADRGPDMAVAELRGLRRRSMATMVLREPALLLAVATPVGLAIAWLIVGVLASHLFGPDVHVRIDSLALAAALATFALGMAAAALGVRTLIRPSLVNEPRATSAKRAARGANVLDLLVLLLATAAVVELLTAGNDLGGTASGGTGSNPLAALAPALIGIAVGVAGARLLPLVVSVVARSVQWTRRVGVSLACVSIMRRPGNARRVMVPAIAVGLLVFSIAAFQVARANRQRQALFTTGAAVVDQVRPAPGVDLVSAVRRADPGGHEAMAVAIENAPSGTTLAVDSSRLANLGIWPASLANENASQVARYLSPPARQPLTISSSRAIRFGVDLTSPVSPAPSLQVDVYDQYLASEQILQVPTLLPGSHTYTIPFFNICKESCRFDSVTAEWQPAVGSKAFATSVNTRFYGFEEETAPGHWKALPSGFASAGDWIGTTSALQLSNTRDGVIADFHINISQTPPAMQRADRPLYLPAVITTTVQTANVDVNNPDLYPANGIDGSQITVTSHVVTPALPAVGNNAILVDLPLAEKVASGTPGASYEVWFRSQPSAAVLQAIRSQGVTILSSKTASTTGSLLSHSGPALGFELFLLAAIAAVLLSLGALVFSVASGSRRRAFEVMALSAAGVPRRTLRLSLVGEYLAIVLAGVVLGVIAGLLTVRLALSALPEFTAGRVGPALGIFVPWGLVLLGSLASLVVLAVATSLATALVMRRATPDCLRVSQ